MIRRLEAGLVRLLFRYSRFTRVIMVALFTCLALVHISKREIFLSQTVWFCEGLLYLGFVLAYAIRHDALEPANRLREILLPPICALLPFALLYDLGQSFNQLRPVYAHMLHLPHYAIIQWFFIIGTSITLAGLMSLRGSFSILTEVRPLVTTGIYRYVSHPMYLGEAIAALGSTWLRSAPDKWLLFFLFLVLQYLRLRNEEEKLRRIHSHYDDWKSRTLIRV